MLEAQIDQQARAVMELQANVVILLQKEHQHLQGANCATPGKPPMPQSMVGLEGNLNSSARGLEDMNLSAQLDRIESRISHLQDQTSGRHSSKVMRKHRPRKIQRELNTRRKHSLTAMDEAVGRLSDILKGVEKSLHNERLGKDRLMGNTLARIEAMEALLHLQEDRISQMSSRFGVVNVNSYPSVPLTMWPTHLDSRYVTPMYASASFWSLPTVLAEALGIPDGAWDMDLDEDDVLLDYLINIGVPGALLHASREVVDDHAWLHPNFLHALISWLEYECCRLMPSFASKPQPPQQHCGYTQKESPDSIGTALNVCQNTNESRKAGIGGVPGSDCCDRSSSSEIKASQEGRFKKPNGEQPSVIEHSCLALQSRSTISTDNGPSSQQLSSSSKSSVLEREPVSQPASCPQIDTGSGDEIPSHNLHTPLPPNNSDGVCGLAKTQMDGNSSSKRNVADEVPPTPQVDHISSEDVYALISRREEQFQTDPSASLSSTSKDFSLKPSDCFGPSNEKVTNDCKSEDLPNAPGAMHKRKDRTPTSPAVGVINLGICEQLSSTSSVSCSEDKVATRRRAKSCGSWPFPTIVRHPNSFARGSSEEINRQFELSDSSEGIFEPINKRNSFSGQKKKKKPKQCSFEAERILGGQRVGSFCDHPEAVYIDNPIFGKKWASSNYELSLEDRASARTNPLFEHDIKNAGGLPVLPVCRGDNWIVPKTDTENEEWTFQSGLQTSQTRPTLRL